LNKESNSN